MQEIITFDGTAGSGKGTIAKAIAKHYDLKYLDTGKLYRALASLIITNNCADNFIAKLASLTVNITEDLLANPVLYNEDIGAFASIIAANASVRKALYNFQIEFINNHKGCVLDGRDTGSVIAPQAKFKFYVDADIEIRASRRYMQNKTYYDENNIMMPDLKLKMAQRDEQDKNREIAPLIIATGAKIIDNSEDDLVAIIKKVIDIIDFRSD